MRAADPEAEGFAGALGEGDLERGAVGELQRRGERRGEEKFGAVVGAELRECGEGGGLGVIEERFAVAQSRHAGRVVEDDAERETFFAECGFPKGSRESERERDEGEDAQGEEDFINEAVLEDVVFDRAIEESQRGEAAFGITLAVNQVNHHGRGDGEQAEQKRAGEKTHRALLIRNFR